MVQHPEPTSAYTTTMATRQSSISLQGRRRGRLPTEAPDFRSRTGYLADKDYPVPSVEQIPKPADGAARGGGEQEATRRRDAAHPPLHRAHAGPETAYDQPCVPAFPEPGGLRALPHVIGRLAGARHSLPNGRLESPSPSAAAPDTARVTTDTANAGGLRGAPLGTVPARGRPRPRGYERAPDDGKTGRTALAGQKRLASPVQPDLAPQARRRRVRNPVAQPVIPETLELGIPADHTSDAGSTGEEQTRARDKGTRLRALAEGWKQQNPVLCRAVEDCLRGLDAIKDSLCDIDPARWHKSHMRLMTGATLLRTVTPRRGYTNIRFDNRGTTNLLAVLVYMTGEASTPCAGRCGHADPANYRYLGPDCITSTDPVVRRKMKGACANCYLNNQGAYCSHVAGRERSVRLGHPDVPTSFAAGRKDSRLYGRLVREFSRMSAGDRATKLYEIGVAQLAMAEVMMATAGGAEGGDVKEWSGPGPDPASGPAEAGRT